MIFQVLELGAGTGICSLALASLGIDVVGFGFFLYLQFGFNRFLEKSEPVRYCRDYGFSGSVVYC